MKATPISIWFTGLPGSGKTTLANALKASLQQEGITSIILDGDEVRKGICSDLGFSLADREENIRRVAELNSDLLKIGLVVINSFVSPTEAIRAKAQTIIGEERFVLVFVDSPIEVCITRDPKGMYKKALAEKSNNFTGLGQDFEIPNSPAIHLKTNENSVEECVTEVLRQLK